VNNVEDLYSFYVFFIGLDPEVAEFWTIDELNQLVINKVAIENYINSD